MLFAKRSVPKAPALFAAFLMLALCVACTAQGKKASDDYNSRLMAENSTMKRRLPLIERENDVLNKENLQHRKRIQELETAANALNADLARLKAKYADDMSAAEAQIVYLHELIQTMENENAHKVEELVSANAASEEDAARAIHDLHEQIEAQKEAHRGEIERMAQAHVKEASDLSTQIEDLKKALDAKALEISSFKMAIGEISSRLGEATALAEGLKKERDQVRAELQALKAANEKLARELNALSNVLSPRKAGATPDK